jgi:hypothetical protein
MTVSNLTLQLEIATKADAPAVIRQALQEAYALCRRASNLPKTDMADAAAFTDASGLISILRSLKPHAADNLQRSALDTAIKSVETARRVVLARGTPTTAEERAAAKVAGSYAQYVSTLPKGGK